AGGDAVAADDAADRAGVGGRLPVGLAVGGGGHVQVRLVHHLAGGAGGAEEAGGPAVRGHDRVRAGRQRRPAEGGLAARVHRDAAGQDGAAVQERDGAGGHPGAAKGEGDGGGEGHRVAVDRGAGRGRQGDGRVGGLHLVGADVHLAAHDPVEAALVG